MLSKHPFLVCTWRHDLRAAYTGNAIALFLLSMVMILASCTRGTDSAQVDRSFLTEEPCIAPCWYGLELDISDSADVYATLSKLPFVEQATVRPHRANWRGDEQATEITYGCLQPKTEVCGAAILSHGNLKALTMNIYYDLTFERIVQKLGVPDYVDYSVFASPELGTSIGMNWPEKRIEAEYRNPSNPDLFQALRGGRGIPAETKVTTLWYLSQDQFRSIPGGSTFRIAWPGFQK